MRSILLRRWGVLLGVLAVMATQASGAGAVSGVSITPTGSTSVSGTLELLSPAWGTIRCSTTFTGSFESRLVAITGETQIGNVTELRTSGCSGGSVRAVLGLPAPIRLKRLNENNPRYAVATRVSRATLSMAGLGFRVLFSSGEECLIGGTEGFSTIGSTFERVGETEYSMRVGFGLGSGGTCRLGGALMAFELGSFSPSRTFTFLAGNEVIDGPTPNPTDFGTVEVGALRQRAVTIGSTRGGRIEEIVVTSARYFAITDPNGCRGSTLAEGGTCTINVILSAPTEAGRAVSDTLTTTIAGTRYEATLRAST
jgi:hypothetical protein